MSATQASAAFADLVRKAQIVKEEDLARFLGSSTSTRRRSSTGTSSRATCSSTGGGR